MAASEHSAPPPTPASAHRMHPWHGVAIGDAAPRIVTAYIEIVPTEMLKYELDKASGFLKIDRPQAFSSGCPSLYGLIPQTYCAEHIAELCAARTERSEVVGDGDPLDICVLTEKTVSHGDILVQAVPIGGFRMIDGGQADDKIVAVLRIDALYGAYQDIADCPRQVIQRLEHYFLTYKQGPDPAAPRVEIIGVYDRQEAYEVITRSQQDYRQHFPSQ